MDIRRILAIDRKGLIGRDRDRHNLEQLNSTIKKEPNEPRNAPNHLVPRAKLHHPNLPTTHHHHPKKFTLTILSHH